MAKVKDLRSYFKQSEKKNDSMPSVLSLLSLASGNVSTAELAVVGEEIKESCQPRKHYNTNILEGTELELPWISFTGSIRDTHFFNFQAIIGNEKLLVVTNYKRKKI